MRPAILSIAAALLVLLPIAAPAQDGSVTVPGFSAATSADAIQIAIVGPDKANPLDEVTFRLNGTPALDLTKPLTDQLSWLMGADRMYVWLASPGQPMVPLDVRGELVFAAAGATMQPIIRFTAGEPGEYRVLVDWHLGQHQLVERMVTVGDKPNPTPPPVPPVPGDRWVIVVSESRDRTPQEAALLASVRRWLDQQKLNYRFLDPTTEAAWAAPYKAEIERRRLSLPVLEVVVPSSQSSDGAYLAVRPLPQTSAEAIKIIQEALK